MIAHTAKSSICQFRCCDFRESLSVDFSLPGTRNRIDQHKADGDAGRGKLSGAVRAQRRLIYCRTGNGQRRQFRDSEIVVQGEHSRFFDSAEAFNDRFHSLRADRIATDVQGCLLTAGDDEIPFRGQMSDVAGIEIPLAKKRPRSFRIAKIFRHHLRAADAKFAVLTAR
jgi:hypothetical protein